MERYKELDAKTISHTLNVLAFSGKAVENSFVPTKEMLNRIELVVSSKIQDYMQSDSLANVLVALLRLGY